MNTLLDLASGETDRSSTMTRVIRAQQRNERWLFISLLALTFGLTPLMVYTQLKVGFLITLSLIVVGVVVVMTIRWPVLGFYTLAACAVVVEEETLPYSYNIITDHLYVFHWPAQLQGQIERPIGFLALFIVLVIIGKRLAGRLVAPMRLGPLILPFLFLLACVAMGVAHGLTSGGNPRIIVLEVRPFWYLFLNYLLAYNLVTKKSHVIGFLWITVIGTFIKAIQGFYIVFGPLGGHISGQNEIMAHEQSFFFILVLLLIVICVLLGQLYRLLWIAVLSTPFLVIALIANNRRADYAAFLIGTLCVWLFIVVVRPQYRTRLITGMLVALVLFGGYVLAFQHSTGSFAEPAHSVVSIIHPSSADARDQASNLYRYIEDYDLKFTERQSPILGYGFGRQYLQPMVLPNIIALDPYYLYIPHNTILWVWMRLGPIGYGALFYLLGACVIRSGIMARTLKDRDLQLVAIFAIGVVIIEIPLAYADYQLFFYRNIFYLGLLMGMVMRLPAIDRAEQERMPEHSAARAESSNATSSSPAERQSLLARSITNETHDNKRSETRLTHTARTHLEAVTHQ